MNPVGVKLGPDEVIVVTGGARGIGAECAARVAARTGAAVILVGRSEPDHPEVAAKLYISDKTERTHVANILKKLRVRSKLQAVVFAAATGFVELSVQELEPAQASPGLSQI